EVIALFLYSKSKNRTDENFSISPIYYRTHFHFKWRKTIKKPFPINFGKLEWSKKYFRSQRFGLLRRHVRACRLIFTSI
ncbi:hypothetical protein, partial [Staphylococcus aureus]